MRVHLIKERTIWEYVEENPVAKSAFKNWLRVINEANWGEPKDILLSFRNADILGRGTNRVVFDVGGNKFRCICTYKFGEKYIHFICELDWKA